MKFVVIGGDAAGMSAASRAKRQKSDIDVTVMEETNDVSYSACGMPYNLADPNREMNDLVVRKASVFRDKQGIDLFVEHQVKAIDTKHQIVSGTCQDGRQFEFPYDKLLIATGASPIKPDIPGIDLPGVYALKRLQDGRTIKKFIKERDVKHVTILGMGYIALEVCEALSALGMRVTMIKPRPQFLPWMNPEMAQLVKNEVVHHQVEVLLGQKIIAIRASSEQLTVETDKTQIDTDMVIVAIGVQPNSQLATAARIQTSVHNAIAVDHQMRTSDPNIFAAGDCADAYHIVTGKKTWIPLALRANRAGWAAADVICEREVHIHGVAGTGVFKVFGLQVAKSGLTKQEALEHEFDPIEVTITSRSRAHAHPGSQNIWVHMLGDKKTGRLLGAQMVGLEGVAHRINAVAVALHSQMTVMEFSQTDMAYAPPFSPVWDPMLTAANQLLKKM